MARSKRYHIPGSLYHVMLRGNDGQDIFFTDEDRCAMCFLLQEGTERYGHRIHAFCFMKNHIHLLIQVSTIPISKIIQNLAFRYSQRINKRNERKGHLFQGRFKSILIEEHTYFLRLLRYIHMNPVRAKLVNNPEDYFWSGHNVYLCKNEITWLTVDYGLSKFDKIKELAKMRYLDYVLKKESPKELEELRKGFKEGQVLGDDIFLKIVKEKNQTKAEMIFSSEDILNAVCHVLEIPKEIVLSTGKSQKASFARGLFAMVAKERGISIEKIASLMSRDGSTISSLLSRFHVRNSNSIENQEIIKNVRSKAKQIAELQV